ncbi:MAG TPA: nitrate reductase associated protein [Candidatus Nanopelagicales bacterium]|nr:nitrate reductase associated protein [Candidatus Nanopelagicales bacterium]
MQARDQDAMGRRTELDGEHGRGDFRGVYRQFTFEGDVHVALDCVPLAVRRKLDLAALKISLAGWQALPRAARLSLCHLPVESAEEVAVYAEVLRGFAGDAGVALSALPEVGREAWSAAAAAERLRARLGEEAPGEAEVGRLDEEERYAIVKLAEPRREVGKLRLLLGELGLGGGGGPGRAADADARATG